MSFVLLLLLSISTLVQVEQSSASINKAQLEAKQGALLALNQALGTLQAEMGPDQRISANADLFSNSGDQINSNSMAVAHPYLVGVWDTSGDNTANSISDRESSKWTIDRGIDYNARATSGFRRWLISDDGDLDPSTMALAANTAFEKDGNVPAFKAVGAGTLRPETDGDLSGDLADKEIWAPLKDVTTGGNDAASARIGWVVLDESVKARMNQTHNLASTNNPSNTEKLEAWDNAGNIGIQAMGSNNEFQSFNRASLEMGKISSFANASLFMGDSLNGSMAADTFGPYYHDLSLYSAGVMADVVNGGLRRDLSTLAEEKPSDYMGRYLYSDTTDGQSQNPNADPKWSAILDYISLYKDDSRLDARSAKGPPTALMNQDEWSGNRTSRPGISSPLQAPATYRMAPAIAQFETYFSLLPLRPHANYMKRVAPELLERHPWSNGAANYSANETQMLHLIVTPVITLYNPYNVPIEFESIWVVFRDIPVGLRFSRLDQVTGEYVQLSNDFVPIAAMNSKAADPGDGSEQRFTLRLANKVGSGRRARYVPTVLAPGETKVFSPDYDGSLLLAGNSDEEDDLVNWNNSLQFKMEANTGYAEGIGLMWDAFVPGESGNTDYKAYNQYNYTGVALSDMGGESETTSTYTHTDASHSTPHIFTNKFDSIRLELSFVDGTINPPRDAPNNDERSGTFPIELYSQDPEMEAPGEGDGRDEANLIGRYVFDYNTGSSSTTSSNNRRNLLLAGDALDQEEEILAQADLRNDDIWTDDQNRSRTQITVNEIDPHTFAAFRVGGKVIKRTTGAPFQPTPAVAFSNSSVLSGHQHVGEESSAFSSYDMYIVTPENGIGDVEPTVTPDNRGFFFSGYDSFDGTQMGTLFEVPLTPLQSLASLQHANIAASGYLPQVSNVVGNSWAHPLIDSDQAQVSGTNYGLFDHSFIANTRLWDTYYFSTLADKKSVIDSSGDSYSEVVSSFIDNANLPNPNFKFHLPAGTELADVTNLLASGNSPATDAYQKVAAFQLQDGTFNINSTSVDAWKAMLATTDISSALTEQPIYFEPEVDSGDFTFNSGASTPAAIYSRFRIPNFNRPLEESLGNTNSGGDAPSTENYAVWQGYRQLDEATLDELAEEIVNQVRHRGPFLSVADFVNRRLGAESDQRSQMGTIDAAIAATSTINEDLTDSVGEEVSGAIENHITDNDFGMIKNEAAISGHTTKGVPAYLTQADILQQIGSRISARSDTFVIRAYGEVVHPITGKVSASSLCEAVVQRIPDYVDNSQEPYFDSNSATVGPDGLSSINERFGRQFKIIQLSWLDPNGV